MWVSSKIIPLQSREAVNFRLDTEGAAASILIMVVVTGHAAAALHGADRDGLLPMTVCIQDRRSGGDAWMGCRGRRIGDTCKPLHHSCKFLQVDIKWWTWWDSNPRPSDCQTGGLLTKRGLRPFQV